MTTNTIIRGKEAKDFIYYLLGELDNNGYGFDYWYKKFIQENYTELYRDYKKKRKCFGLYNPDLKLCRELCQFRDNCKEKSPLKGIKKCSHCGRPAMINHRMCKYHLVKIREWERQAKENQIKNGKCISCGGINDRKDTLAKRGRHKGNPLKTCSRCATNSISNILKNGERIDLIDLQKTINKPGLATSQNREGIISGGK